MGRLQKLESRIKALPQLNSERERISIAARVASDVRAASTALALASSNAMFIDQLMGVQTAQKTTKEVINGCSEAIKSLRKCVRADDVGPEKTVSEGLEALRRKTERAQEVVKKQWESVRNEIRVVDTISSIAKSLKLPSETTLGQASQQFRKVTNSPPTTNDECDAVAKARESCHAAIGNSGLTGAVQRLLEGALNRNGDPRLLFDAEVKAFLDRYPKLWQSLKLSLN